MLSTVNSANIAPADWVRVQNAWFPLLQSETITTAEEVTDQSLADYLNTKIIDQTVCDYEKKVYDSSFSFNSPTNP
ncbi:MAG: hypothetical protein HC773_19505 [Scytonema sp. CRU_2_7]|nr:hypothetical protein [Scytonema sp. CRU_2_7]